MWCVDSVRHMGVGPLWTSATSSPAFSNPRFCRRDRASVNVFSASSEKDVMTGRIPWYSASLCWTFFPCDGIHPEACRCMKMDRSATWEDSSKTWSRPLYALGGRTESRVISKTGGHEEKTRKIFFFFKKNSRTCHAHRWQLSTKPETGQGKIKGCNP